MPERDARADAMGPLSTHLLGLLHDLRSLVSDRVELLSLELQRATIALTRIAALVVAVVILGVTAWLALWGGIVAGLVALGMPLGWALLATLTVNLLAAWGAVVRIRRLLPQVSLPATRRHLVGTPSTEAP